MTNSSVAEIRPLLEAIIQVRGGVVPGFHTLNERANEMAKLAAECLLCLDMKHPSETAPTLPLDAEEPGAFGEALVMTAQAVADTVEQSAPAEGLTERALLDLLVKYELMPSHALTDPEGYDAGETLGSARNFCHVVLRSVAPQPRQEAQSAAGAEVIGYMSQHQLHKLKLLTGDFACADIFARPCMYADIPLYARPAPPASERMVMVPREPTEHMRSAFSIAWLNAQRMKPPVKFAAAYTAMLSAAPQPPAALAKGEKL